MKTEVTASKGEIGFDTTKGQDLYGKSHGFWTRPDEHKSDIVIYQKKPTSNNKAKFPQSLKERLVIDTAFATAA